MELLLHFKKYIFFITDLMSKMFRYFLYSSGQHTFCDKVFKITLFFAKLAKKEEWKKQIQCKIKIESVLDFVSWFPESIWCIYYRVEVLVMPWVSEGNKSNSLNLFFSTDLSCMAIERLRNCSMKEANHKGCMYFCSFESIMSKLQLKHTRFTSRLYFKESSLIETYSD